MRNFILGKSVAGAGALDAVAAGAVGFAYIDASGKLAITADGTKDITSLVLGRSAEKGGPVILPISKKNFSYVKGEYIAATTFNASITIPDPVAGEEYTIIAVKKGVKFNERNKWTASVVAKDSDTAATIAAKLVAYFMDGTVARYGLSAEAEGAVITLSAETAGVDWKIVPADALSGITVTVNTSGIPAYGDASYIKDLANKAAADAGFEYTYMGDVNYLYPDYPLNPLANPDAADSGFNIITLRFAEPRKVKTVDEVVNQIVQIAFPASVSLTALIATLDSMAE